MAELGRLREALEDERFKVSYLEGLLKEKDKEIERLEALLSKQAQAGPSTVPPRPRDVVAAARRVEDFAAFDGAQDVMGVQELLGMEPDGIIVGCLPLALPQELKMLDAGTPVGLLHVVLSPTGVLAWWAVAHATVYLAELVGAQRCAKITGVTSLVTIAITAKDIVLLSDGVLASCDVEMAFGALSVPYDDLLTRRAPPCMSNTIRTDTAARDGTVMFRGANNTLLRLTLSTLECKEASSCTFRGDVGSFYGIDVPDVVAIVDEGFPFDVIPLSASAGPCLCTIPDNILGCLVSASDPCDLSKAVIIAQDGSMTTLDATVFIEEPFRYQPGPSIARLYKDVFIAFDEKAQRFVLARFIVP